MKTQSFYILPSMPDYEAMAMEEEWDEYQDWLDSQVLEPVWVWCYLCGYYKPLSEMGEVACKECEGNGSA